MFDRLLNNYHNMSISRKMKMILIPLLCLSIVLNLCISDIVYSKTISNQAKADAQNECNILTNRINEIYSSVQTCSDTVIKDINTIYKDQANPKRDLISFISLRIQISSALSYDIRCFPNISSCIFLDQDGNIVQTGLDATPDFSAIKKQFQSSNLEASAPNLIAFPVSAVSFLDASKKNPVLTLGKKVINIQNGETIGYVFFNVFTSTLLEAFPNEATSQTFYLLDNRGRVVATRGENSLELLHKANPKILNSWPASSQMTMTNQRFNGSEYLLLEQSVKSLNWVIISQISLKALYQPLYANTLLTIIIGIFILIMTSLLISLASTLISSPIKQLTESVLRVGKGHLSMDCSINSNDEIGTLSKGFAKMLSRLNSLLFQLKEDEKCKQQYKLALLQNQIRPHFLYNSLDLIFVLNEMGYSNKVSVATKALADFYRISLSKGSEIIKIGEEIKNVENYLTIQHIRFSDIFQYRMEISPEILEDSIPKLTLQPLVENAIYHGLKGKEKDGHILIKGEAQKDTILLAVEDDGVGINEKKIPVLLQSDSPERKNFGLQCVNERIRLYFGDSYGLIIRSKAGVGTSVQIHLPKIPMESKIDTRFES
jgi:two-component system sensor histidine kinase YesM